jgi:hypothetical protein
MKKFTLIGLVASLLLMTGLAAATHKTWMLKNSGANCVWATPSTNDRLGIAYLYNYTTSSRMAICPVALSGRWGSNGPGGYGFNAKRWGAVRSAIVYGQRQGAGYRTLSCSGWMKASNGSNYFSQTVYNSGDLGMAKMVIASEQEPFLNPPSVGWGGTLEANEGLTAVSLDYYCSVPDRSAILGYKAQTCQTYEDCYEGQDPEYANGSGVAGSWAQTSGIECAPTSDSPTNIWWSHRGMTVTGNSPLTVFCPITPVADDTHEINREVRYTTVRFAGGSASSSCVSSGTCPSCRLMWFGRDGLQYNSPPFAIDSAGNSKVAQSFTDKYNVGREVSLGVECRVPSGVSIEGLYSYVTRAGVTDGGI